MAFPTSIAASQYSGIAISRDAVPASLTETDLKSCFATAADFVAIDNLREIPAVGAQPNIVRVPTYGRKTSQSVGAQNDAPDLDITVNYVPSVWASAGATFATTGTIGDAIGDGIAKVFQLAILPAQAPSYVAAAAGLGAVPNAVFYWVGKLESISVQTSLDDATTASLSISTSSDFYGPFTVAGV